VAEETRFLIPVSGLIVRDPRSKHPLPIDGAEKPWIGPEGRYWRRRVSDGSCIIRAQRKRAQAPTRADAYKRGDEEE
jgi:hypothetical protein